MIADIFKRSFLKKGEIPNRENLKKLIIDNVFDLEEEEIHFLTNVLDVHQKIVREIMVPRIDMKTINKKDDYKKLLHNVQKYGHSRMPLIGEDADTVIGIIYSKDFIGFNKKTIPFDEMKKEAYFVPETKKVLDLLNDFQLKKIHMAIVVDEYGGVSGLVTLEDILEMFVGDIQDEYDNEKEQIVKVRKNIYNIDARMLVEEVNNFCHTDLSEELADSIGGLFLELYGGIPVKNDTVVNDKYKLRILNVDGNRINRLQLTII